MQEQQGANEALINAEEIGNGRSLVIVVTKGRMKVKRSLYWIAVPHVVFIKEGVDIQGLMNPQCSVGKIALELYTQEGLHWSQILNAKGLAYLALDVREERQVIRARQAVVNVNGEEAVDEVAGPNAVKNEQGVIEFGMHEPKTFKNLA